MGRRRASRAAAIVEDRDGRRSILITSQLPVPTWHEGERVQREITGYAQVNHAVLTSTSSAAFITMKAGLHYGYDHDDDQLAVEQRELEARYEGAADPIGKSHFHALWLLSSGY